MSENSKPPSGTEVASLGVDVNVPADATKELDKMADAAIHAADAFDKLGDNGDELLKKLTPAQRKLVEMERAALAQAEAVTQAEQAISAYNNMLNGAGAKAASFLEKLKDQVETFNMSEEALLRHRAAQVNATQAAEPLIQALMELKRISEENAIQQRRDVELRNMSIQAMKEEAAQARQAASEADRISLAKQEQFHRESKARADYIAEYTKWWQDQISIQESSQAALNAQRNRALEEQRRLEESSMASLNAQRIRSLNEQAKLEESARTSLAAQRIRALREQEQEEEKTRIIFAAFKRRTLAENAKEEARLAEEAAEKSAQAAEKQAMDEIRWMQMSVRQRISELEKLKAYQGDSRIRQNTIMTSFSGAAQADLPNLERYKRELEEADEKKRKLARTTRSLSGVMTRLRNVMALVGTYLGGREIIQAVDNYIKFTSQLKVATDTTREYAIALDEVKRIARNTEVDLQSTGVFYARVTRAVEQLGLTQNQVSTITETVTAALRAGGATAQETKSAMLQLSQAMGRGVLDGQEFNAIMEASPVVMKALADGIGVPVAALKEMARNQEITTEMMAIAFTDPKINAAMVEQAEKVTNISSAMSVLNNEFTLWIGEMDEATGFSKHLTDAIKFLADNLSTVAAVLATIVTTGIVVWAAKAVAAIGSMSAAVTALGVATKAMLVSIGPAGWLVLGLGTAAAAYTAFSDKAKKANADVKKSTEETTQDILAALDKQIETLKDRNDKQEFGVGPLNTGENPGEQRMEQLRNEMERVQHGIGQYEKMNQKQRIEHLLVLAQEYSNIYNKLQLVSEEQERALGIQKTKAAAEWMEKYATNAERAAKEIAALEKAIGRDHEDFAKLEKRILDRYSDKKRTRKQGEDPEVTAYKNLISQIRAKTDEVEIELKTDEKASASKRMLIKLDHELSTGKLKLREGHEKEIRAAIEVFAAREEELKQRKEQLEIEKEYAKWVEEVSKRKQEERENLVDGASDELTANKTELKNFGKDKAAIAAAELAEAEEKLREVTDPHQTTAEAEAWGEVVRMKRENLQVTQELMELESAQKAEESVEKFLEANDAMMTFGETMVESFGKIGGALENLIDVMDKYKDKQKEIDKEKENALESFIKDQSTQEEYVERIAQLEKMSARDRIAEYADMAGAAKGFFDKKTAAYKSLEGIQKAMHLLQIGMQMKELFLLAKKAVLTQAGGDPYTAWGRMALMAAAVAALGFAVGGGFQGRPDTTRGAENRQRTQGTGTVFGDFADEHGNFSEKTKSIQKGIEHLVENSDLTMPKTNAMLRSLRNIENGIGGLANAVLRSVGIVSGNAFGVQTGLVHSGDFGFAKTTVNMIDSGLKLKAGSMADYLKGGNVNQYAESERMESKWWGLDTDYHYDTHEKTAEEAVRMEVARVMRSGIGSIAEASESFGYDKKAMEEWLAQSTWTEGTLSLRGLKGDELNAELESFFGSYFDQMAEMAVPQLEAFQQAGEGYYETLIRVATGIENADVTLERFNIQAVKYEDIMNKQGDVAAEIVRESFMRAEGNASGIAKIIEQFEGSADEIADAYESLVGIRRVMRNTGLANDLSYDTIGGAGGLDNLGNAVDTFYEKFFSDEEKLEMVRKNMQEDFAALGRSVPKSREEFRRMVQAIDTSTDAGKRYQARMLMLADDFDEFIDLTDQVREAWQSVTDSIVDEIKRIRDLVENDPAKTFADAQAEFADLIAKAESGDQEAAARLPEAARRLLELGEKEAKSLEELQRLQAVTANALERVLHMIAEAEGVEVPGFARGGYHSGGFRIVGENGPELEATGPSKIFSSAQTRAILTGNLETELKGLREEVSHLRKENFAAQASIARNTEKMEKVLTRNDTSNGLLTTNTL